MRNRIGQQVAQVFAFRHGTIIVCLAVDSRGVTHWFVEASAMRNGWRNLRKFCDPSNRTRFLRTTFEKSQPTHFNAALALQISQACRQRYLHRQTATHVR
jgi:hypothetical protein